MGLVPKMSLLVSNKLHLVKRYCEASRPGLLPREKLSWASKKAFWVSNGRNHGYRAQVCLQLMKFLHV